ncbi:MAG: GEVED domain-containing protein [Bacteroidota bacterium]
MKNNYLLLLLVFTALFSNAQEKKTIQKNYRQAAYKHMMYDMSVNFYTVCDSAETYFRTIDKDKKGSGYKPFLRWKHDNESKYYPSGNRMIDHFLPHKEFERLKKESQSQKTTANTLDWTLEGPALIGTIAGHYAPGLGRMEYVEVNRNNAQQIYMGSRSGGLWRTNNEGGSWIHNTDFLPGSGVDAIAAKPTNFNSVLINVRMANTGHSFGIYRSNDGGVTFQQTNFNPATLGFGGLGSNFKINIIRYHPTVANMVFVGTDRGIFKSTDDMATWTRLNNSWDVEDIEFHPTNSSIIYVYENYYWGSNKNKIHKSVNQGVSYTALADVPGNSNAEINISVSPTCPECIYLVSDNGIWNSTDTGTTFTTIQNPAPAGVSLWYGVPNDTDPTKIVCGYLDMYRSSDSGATFTQATWWSLGSAQHGAGSMQTRFNNSQVYVHADMDYLTCVNGVFYACTDGFLSKSADNGLTWTRLNADTCLRENYNLGISQSNNERLICGAQDNGTTVKTENGWIEYYGADGMEGLIHPLNDDWMIGSLQYGGRQRSFDGGLSVSGCSQPQSGSGNAGWVAPILYDTNNQMTVYAFGSNVFRSTEFGNNWVTLAAPATFGNSTIDHAAIAFNNSNRIVASSDENIEMSNDAGVSFASIRGTLPALGISDIAFDPNNDNRIIVTYSNWQNNNQKVFITNDAGVTWQNITYNLGNMPVRTVVIENSSDSTIYLGTEIGVYKKTLLATTWTMYNASLPNVAVEELEINYGANTIKAATWGRGIWEAKLQGKENYPEIVKTDLTSPVTFDSPKTGVAQYVTSNINYDGTISNAKVTWAINNPVFNGTNVIPMYLVTGNTWKSNAPIPDFPVGTKVYFKVIVTGSNSDTSETFKFMYEIKPYDYCVASGENVNGSLRINSFVCANLNNVTNTYNAYTYYSSTPILLNKGNTYAATGNFNTTWGSNDFLVWIDYNNDGVFSLTEKVVSDLDTGNLGTGNFTVPFDAVSGNVRMRVRLGYWGDYSNACGTTLGEVEDYLVQISDNSAPNLTMQSNPNYCVNTPFQLTYTGSAVDELKWTIQRGTDVYTFSGTPINVSGLPMGQYSIALSGKKNGVYYTQLLNAIFEIKSTTWNGSAWSNGLPNDSAVVFTGNYTISSDMNVCSVLVSNNAVVTIQQGANLQVNGQIQVNNGSTLLVENKAAILQTKDVTNIGNSIVKSNSAPMVRLDYTAWTSPVTGQQLQAFSPNTLVNRFYEYLYTGTTTATAYQTIVPTNNFSFGKGYMIRASNIWPTSTPTVFNGQFTGVPNNGPVTLPIGIGYNLVGNPYPSPINGNAVLTGNPSVGTLYFWTHNVPQNGAYVAQSNYASYTTLGGTAAVAGGTIPNGKIGVGQGFFVRTTTGGNFTLNNSVRRKAESDTQFFKNNTDLEVNRFWLNLTSDAMPFNQILIGYTENSSLNFDQNIDGKILETNKTNLYSVLNNEALVIQGRGSFNSNDEVAIGFNVLESGNYIVSIPQKEGVFNSTGIYLKDTTTGTVQSLQDPVTISLLAGTYNDRFKIVYNELLSTEDITSNFEIDLFPNPIKNGEKLNLTNIKENYTISLYDVTGKLVFEKECNTSQIALPNLNQGTYLVKINTETKVWNEKLIVK